jgi:hypothetical protein
MGSRRKLVFCKLPRNEKDEKNWESRLQLSLRDISHESHQLGVQRRGRLVHLWILYRMRMQSCHGVLQMENLRTYYSIFCFKYYIWVS